MPHFFLGNLLFFGSRSQSSGDCTQDVSLCNQPDLGASWPVSPRSFASLSLSLPPWPQLRLPQMPSFSLGGIDPWHPVSARTPSCASGPCLTPISRLRWFRLVSGRLIQTLPPSINPPLSTPLYQLPSINSPLSTPLCQPPSASSTLLHRLRQGTNPAFFLFQG